MSGLLELHGFVDPGQEDVDMQDCNCTKGPCPCQTFDSVNASDSRDPREVSSEQAAEPLPWAGWEESPSRGGSGTPSGTPSNWQPQRAGSAADPSLCCATVALSSSDRQAQPSSSLARSAAATAVRVAAPAPLPAPRRSERGPNYYTLSEVQQHVTADDCWLIAHGKVYDVTSFIDQHPAGARAILRHAGTDATVDFDFHSNNARKLWKPLQIGYFDDEQPGLCAIS